MGPDAQTIGLSYDANQRLDGVTPPGRTKHAFAYSGMDVISTYTPPQPGHGTTLPRRETTYQQAGDGIVTLTRLADNRTIGTPLDGNRGRVQNITLGRGTIVPTYHPTTGRVTSVSAPGGVAYDIEMGGDYLYGMTWRRASDSLVSETLIPRGGVALTYDSGGRVATVGTRNAGSTTNAVTATYGYDNDDLLTSVAAPGGTLTVVRNPTTGLPGSMSVGALSTAITPTAFGELAAISTTHTDTTTQVPRAYGNAYTYDNAGRIDTGTEMVDGTSHVYDYDYDAAGRLDVVRRDSVIVEDYGYDANGNRESSVNFEGTSAATYDDQDRLLTYGDKTFTYNAHGQLTTMTHNGVTTTYVYDELDNLISVSRPGEPVIEYVIDGANRRVGRKVAGVLERGWLYLGQLEPVAEVNASGVVTATFIYGTMPHVPDLVVRGGVTYRVITDHLGSVRRVVNVATGAVAQEFEYDAWGNILASSGDMALQPFRFAGGLYDAATGFTRFGARDYDASVGRWTSKDPIGFRGGQTNLYEYAGADPVNAIDPTGKVWHIVAGAAGGALSVIVGSLISGHSFTFSDVVGGAVAGGVTAGTGNVLLGAAAGGAATRLVDGVADILDERRRDRARAEEVLNATEGADWNNSECSEGAREDELEDARRSFPSEPLPGLGW